MPMGQCSKPPPPIAHLNEHNPAAQGETAIDPPSASPVPDTPAAARVAAAARVTAAARVAAAARAAASFDFCDCSLCRSCRSCSSNRSCSSSRSCSSGRCLPLCSPGLAPRHQGEGRWIGALRPSSEGGKRSSRIAHSWSSKKRNEDKLPVAKHTKSTDKITINI